MSTIHEKTFVKNALSLLNMLLQLMNAKRGAASDSLGGLKMREWKMQEWKYRHEAVGKGRGWKMREWKNRHGNVGVENAGVEIAVR